MGVAPVDANVYMRKRELLAFLEDYPDETPIMLTVPAGEDAFAIFSAFLLTEVGSDSGPVVTISGRDPKVYAHEDNSVRPWGFIIPADEPPVP